MRVALISDVHSNLAALDAVLAAAEAEGAEAVWHMGDLVGYGPQPGAVIARMAEIQARCVLGNHDAAAAGLAGTDEFNGPAGEAARWTARTITAEERALLAALPKVAEDGEYTRVHGSLRDPIWEYLDSVEAATAHFALQGTRFSVFGHTHLPIVIYQQDDHSLAAHRPGDGAGIDIGIPGARVAINPGGAGQPRDGDPRACYALLDTGNLTVRFHRVAYDIAATQELMAAAGLPEPLIRRLARGR
ncbi:MAG: metallophosphoesterase family protein [Chloroflexi bacterium]|nr:metallophosphoesterase family protein [Chloroflexota bacterium]